MREEEIVSRMMCAELNPSKSDGLHFLGLGPETAAGRAVYLTKRAKFSVEQEYRWVWVTEGVVTGYRIVEVPEARDCCRPFF